jgi:hypothetical protein
MAVRPGNFDGIGYTTTGIFSRRALVDGYSKYDDKTNYFVSFRPAERKPYGDCDECILCSSLTILRFEMARPAHIVQFCQLLWRAKVKYWPIAPPHTSYPAIA